MSEWEARVASFLTESARERNWDLTTLTKEQRRELVWDLKQRGGFAEKRAAQFVAGLIGVSSETIERLIQ